ncbi:MAG TPA: flagellar basal body rod C-terminal domain-containing protein [Candidatus Baltobacteraceae bacterium]|nr:flagellar basal body rod C-terminal domain-containing protein [Candidatus Baltobacteraceae bacterium]
MNAARTRLDLAAENLANGSTDGFRRSDARGFLTAQGVVIRRARSTGQGPLRRTGRAFDLAIVGSGSFRVRDAGGRVFATRSGAFTRDRFDRLVDDAGRVLLGARGPLCVPDGASIAADGTVSRNGVMLNRIAVPDGSSVRTGFLEGSNVDAIGEMIDVLTAQRSFEAAQKVLSAIDQTRERANTQVAQIK